MFSRISSLSAKSVLLCNTTKIGTTIPKFRLGNRFQSVSGKTSTVNEAAKTFKLVGAVSSIAGIGFLCFYGFSKTNDNLSIMNKSIMWPPYVRERIHSTYAYFAASTGITAATAISIFRNPSLFKLASRNSIPFMLLSFAALIGTSILTQSIPYSQTIPKHASWLLFCSTLGFTVSPLCLLGGQILQKAALYTLGVVGGLSAVAYSAPSDQFLYMGGPLAMGLGLVFMSSLASMFVNPLTKVGAGIMAFQIYGGLAIFSGFLLYDTQKAVERAKRHPPPSSFDTHVFDPINNSIGIYLDSVNIFIRMAYMLGMGGNKKK